MSNRLPRHVAIIMDGNGRWAKQRQLPRVAGHKAGVEKVRALVERCATLGIECLTLFAFSSENWRRPAAEVRLLIDLFVVALNEETRQLHAREVKLTVIGDRTVFPQKLQNAIADAEHLTGDNRGLQLTLAANYGGRWDITQAARALAQEACVGKLDPAAITAEMLDERMSLAGLPEPDLFIRAGGEQRISNYLLWQLAYTELHFTDCLWPDFDVAQFEMALAHYAGRQRRFGMTAEQLQDSPGRRRQHLGRE